MQVIFTKPFLKYYRKIPPNIRTKFKKQLQLLSTDFQHPSVGAKKMVNKSDVWEGRIDLHWRFTFKLGNDEIILKAIGTHQIYR